VKCFLPSVTQEMINSGRPSVADRGSGMSAGCRPCVQSFADGRIVCCDIISSCQPTATCETVKALLVLSPTYVSSIIAIARIISSTREFFTLPSHLVLSVDRSVSCGSVIDSFCGIGNCIWSWYKNGGRIAKESPGNVSHLRCKILV